MGRPKTERNAMLPPRMIARRQKSGNVAYYYSTPGSDRREIPLGPDRKAALARYHAIADGGTRAPPPNGTARALHKAMVKNARPKGVPVLLTEKDVEQMLADSGGICSVTGLPFDSRQYLGQRIRPWMPSIDRVQPGGPYSLENTRVVCAAVNLAMNQFGEEIFFKIAAAAVLRQRILRSSAKSAERDDHPEGQEKSPP